MKALPSIAFNEFKGSAGNVTARVVKGRQVLSARAVHSGITTIAQAARRCSFAAITRSYKKLTSDQMSGWAVLAEKLQGSVVFGTSAKLTAHNAYVRLNTHRRMAGMPLLEDAPAYVSDTSAVVYNDLWISPENICFVGLQQPTPNHVLVFKMSPSLSPGTTSGWSQSVIITPGYTPEWEEAELTKFYSSVMGYTPEAGKKYYCSFYWLDTSTGFTGEELQVSAICKDESIINNEPYTPRIRVTMDDIETDSIVDLDMEFVPNAPIVNVNVELLGDNIAASSRGVLHDDSLMPSLTSMWLIGRAKESDSYYPQLFAAWTQEIDSVNTLIIANRGGNQRDNVLIDCTGFYI